jgi:hypothetical protein
LIGWRSKLLLLVFLCAAVSWTYADVQSAQASSPGSGAKQGANPVFKATTRLVIVNVVVTDKNNRPVSGLKPSDFKLWDSGKPQRLSAFEAHTFSISGAPATSTITLPEHQYTNFATTQKREALNVILFDLANTPKRDRVVAQKELLKFLANLPPGHPMAMYVLSNRLRMVHYVLRLGVMDRSNQKIGTVEVPLTIAAEEAGK